MIDLKLAERVCGGEAVNLYTNILNELNKNKIKIEKHGRMGSNLIVRYKLSDKIINVTIYPNNKVSVYGDIGLEDNLNYTEFKEKFRKNLSDSNPIQSNQNTFLTSLFYQL